MSRPQWSVTPGPHWTSIALALLEGCHWEQWQLRTFQLIHFWIIYGRPKTKCCPFQNHVQSSSQRLDLWQIIYWLALKKSASVIRIFRSLWCLYYKIILKINGFFVARLAFLVQKWFCVWHFAGLALFYIYFYLWNWVLQRFVIMGFQWKSRKYNNGSESGPYRWT